MNWRTLQVAGAALALAGAGLSGYAQFVFDPSLSPVDTAPDYSSVSSSMSDEDRAAALQDLAHRYEQSAMGERTINVARLAEQQRLFYFGLVLIMLGAGAFALGVQRAKSEAIEESEDYE